MNDELNSAVLSLTKRLVGPRLLICAGELEDRTPCVCVHVERGEYAEKTIPSHWCGFPVKICLSQ